MIKSLFWLLFILKLSYCEDVAINVDDLVGDVEDVKDEEEVKVDPHAEMDEGDFVDEDFYPPHDPIYQPFEETYEQDQAKQAAKPKSTKQVVDNDKVNLNERTFVFEEEEGGLKKPELRLDGMADHEPLYQPEDPGDDAELPPDYKNATVTEDIQDNVDDLLKSHNEVLIGDDVIHRAYDLEDDHEPVYQPSDQDVNDINGHDEL